MKNDYISILDNLRELRLNAFVETFTRLANENPEQAALLAPFLKQMANDELQAKTQKRINRYIHQARFVRLQTIDKFNFNYNASTKKLKNRYLKLLSDDHVIKGIGAIFCGNSGLGKTHLSRALGYAACQRGHSVLFIPCASLLNRLVTAEATKDLERECKKLLNPALLIIDELCYITMSQQEANLFFQVISRRHDNKRPIIVTTNKPFAQWNQVFHGDATAHAIVDRLTEFAEVFYLEGKSYRQTNRGKLN